MPTFLKDLRVNEVSSVDQGAGEGVKIVYMKRDFSEGEREDAADEGEAMPDGSFPIKSEEDLKNAVRLYGNAKDPAKAKAFIIRRARALGALDQLPDDWGVSKKEVAMTEEERKAKEKAEAEATEKRIADAVDKAVAAAMAKAKKKVPAEGEDDEDSGTNDAKEEEAEKASAAMCKGAREVQKMSPKHRAYFDEADFDDKAAAKFLTMKPHERDEHIKDNPDPQEAMPPKVKKAFAELEALKKQNADFAAERERVAFGKRAVEAGLPEGFGEVLRKAYSGDEAAAATIEKKFKALAAQVDVSKLFSEIGREGGATSAKQEVAAKVAELRKADPKLSEAQAFTKVYTDRTNVELKQRYDAENRRAN